MKGYVHTQEETTRLALAGRIPIGAWLRVWDADSDKDYYLRQFQDYHPGEFYPWRSEGIGMGCGWKHAQLVTQEFLNIFCPGTEQLPLLPEKPPRGELLLVWPYTSDLTWRYGFFLEECDGMCKFSLGGATVTLPSNEDAACWRRLTDEEKQMLGLTKEGTL